MDLDAELRKPKLEPSSDWLRQSSVQMCRNCQWWVERKPAAAIGLCRNPANTAENFQVEEADRLAVGYPLTFDLSRCSLWSAKS